MTTGSVRRVSRQDIQLSDLMQVQNLIERCLQLYMNQKEVVQTLLDQAKIEPGFTELVWQKLEEENREFFNAYYLRLMVKHQIVEFNRLLERQVQLMHHQVHPTGVASMPTSNGSHISPVPQNPTCYVPENTGSLLKQENMHNHMSSSLPGVFTNGSSSLHAGMHSAVEMAAHASGFDAPPTMIATQNSNVSLIPGMNGGMIKPEPGFLGDAPYIYGADNNVMETRAPITDGSVASYSSVDSGSQTLNEPYQEYSTFGFLSHIPRNFSLSDLTQSSGIMESYPRSPFLGADGENLLDSSEGEHQGDNKRLDTISEGLGYDDFKGE